MNPKYGARIYANAKTPTIHVIQTKLSGKRYVIDAISKSRNRETRVKQDDDRAIAEAVRAALAGQLMG